MTQDAGKNAMHAQRLLGQLTNHKGAITNSCHVKVAVHTAAAALARASGSDTGAAEAWVLLDNSKTL